MTHRVASPRLNLPPNWIAVVAWSKLQRTPIASCSTRRSPPRSHPRSPPSESSVGAVLAAAPTCFFPYSRIAYGDDYYRRPHRFSWPSPRRGRGIRARSPGWCLPTCILGLGLNVSTSGLLRGGPMSRKLIYVWYACVFLGARTDRM